VRERSEAASHGRPTTIAATVVAVLTLAAWSGFGGGYHFDDEAAAVCDPASQGLGGWADRLTRTLRPATKLTYALEAELGLGPPERRVVSAVVHATGAVAMLLLLLSAPRDQTLGGAALASPPLTVLAATAAVLWAIHPVHAESVLAIAGRSAVLSSALLTWALVAHLHGRRALGVALYLLAGLARETAWLGIVPMIVLELALTPRSIGQHARRLVPVALAAVALASWYSMVPRYRELADYSMYGRPWVASLVRQVAAVPVGVSLYGRPWALSVDHGQALPESPASPGFLLGLCLYGVALAGVVLGLRRAPALALGLSMWLAAILPTQSLVPKLDALTERPLALALGGLFVAAWALRPRRLGVLRFTTASAAALAVVLCGFTLARGALYRSDVLLWRDAAHKSATNPRPHINLAVSWMIAGQPARAARALASARAIDPIDPRVEALSLRLLDPYQEEEGP
jgi:hypothetical protein